MAQYKFDGTNLKRGGSTVANVRGDKICSGSGSSATCNIRGDKICSGSGSSVAFNVSGNDIRKGSGSSKIASMKDVDGAIDGPGHVVKAALWLFFVR
ncbi:MAG: hypothetical protein AB7V45_11390 [Candidatus Krumholzibacteriia bacterium]